MAARGDSFNKPTKPKKAVGRRRVTRAGKDHAGNIIYLCNPDEPWSPRFKKEAIYEIQHGLFTYYIEDSYGRSDIHVVTGLLDQYLRADPDGSASVTLEKLEDC